MRQSLVSSRGLYRHSQDCPAPCAFVKDGNEASSTLARKSPTDGSADLNKNGPALCLKIVKCKARCSLSSFSSYRDKGVGAMPLRNTIGLNRQHCGR